MITSDEAEALVLKFFKEDTEKASAWWTTPNPHFGGTSPVDMVLAGRIHRVFKFIENALINGELP